MTLEEIEVQFNSALDDAKLHGKDHSLTAWAQMYGLRLIAFAEAVKLLKEGKSPIGDDTMKLNLLFDLLDLLEN